MSELAQEIDQFLLARGGPFFELQRLLGLLRENSLHCGRRAILAILLAWGVPFLLSGLQGTAFGAIGSGAFLAFLPGWARFFIAIGLFVLMEKSVEKKIRVQLRQLVRAPLLAPAAFPAAAQALTQALKRRDSAPVETGCLVIALLASTALYFRFLQDDSLTWAVASAGGDVALTPAGWWTVIVSSTLFWFLLLRWIWRIVVWARLLKALSNLDLRLVAHHPDGLGGVAFLGQSPNTFTLFVFAISWLPAALIAQDLMSGQMTVTTYGHIMAAWLVLILLFLCWPLLPLRKPLSKLKQETILSMSSQATRHHRAVERKALGSNVVAADATEGGTPGEDVDVDKLYAASVKMSTFAVQRSSLIPVSFAAVLPLIIAGATQLPLKELIGVAKRLVLI